MDDLFEDMFDTADALGNVEQQPVRTSVIWYAHSSVSSSRSMMQRST
jgi:hypothetical protein